MAVSYSNRDRLARRVWCEIMHLCWMAINTCAAPVLRAVHNTSDEFWLFTCRTSGSRHWYTMQGLCLPKCHSSWLNALFLMTRPRFNSNCTTDFNSIRAVYQAACVATRLTVTSLLCDTNPCVGSYAKMWAKMVEMDPLAVWKAEARLPNSMTRPGCNKGWVRDASESNIESIPDVFFCFF